jgi:hypothetical protein
MKDICAHVYIYTCVHIQTDIYMKCMCVAAFVHASHSYDDVLQCDETVSDQMCDHNT